MNPNLVIPEGVEAPPEIPSLEFLGLCGRGGMATVWRAHHRFLDRIVAVKVLDSAFAGNAEDVRQFMTEGRAMAYMDHPGIVHGYGAECVQGRYLYIMDFIDGYSLGAFLRRRARIPEADARIILYSVAEALGYAWANFETVHCDIKPENLMISTDGTVKITDLGLAREIRVASPVDDGSPATSSVIIEGTPAYMSPEQIRGDALDPRSDIYSLGASVYHLVTGRTLFHGLGFEKTVLAQIDEKSQAPDPRTFAPKLSQGFVNILACMLVKDRTFRYTNWEEVIAACTYLENGGVPPPPSLGIASSFSLLPADRVPVADRG